MLLATVAWGEAGYLALWHAGKLFGMLSTFGSGLMIAQIAPTERLGFWNGVNAGLTNACVTLKAKGWEDADTYSNFNPANNDTDNADLVRNDRGDCVLAFHGSDFVEVFGGGKKGNLTFYAPTTAYGLDTPTIGTGYIDELEGILAVIRAPAKVARVVMALAPPTTLRSAIGPGCSCSATARHRRGLMGKAMGRARREEDGADDPFSPPCGSTHCKCHLHCQAHRRQARQPLQLGAQCLPWPSLYGGPVDGGCHGRHIRVLGQPRLRPPRHGQACHCALSLWGRPPGAHRAHQRAFFGLMRA